ncbi:MAG: Calx-beta domain-containing protein [Chlamydiota bacterium]|nr:Calx-beta domain-containing protein [Chlamydiota bacterium]
MGILRLEPLEDRIVLDGAIAVDIATPPTQTADTHVLVISDAVADADAVAEAAGDDVVVLKYDSDSNDLNALSQQISDALGGEKADSIAFFTAGNPGEINLFDDMAVNEVSIKTQQMVDFWSDIGSYVSQNGSVDILGCNIAGSTEGVQLLESIEVIMNDKGTDINLSASTDLTGHEDLGGDWVLEFSTSIDFTDHDVEAVYFDTNEINTWEHVLAPVISIGTSAGGDNPIEGGSAAFRLVNLEDQPSGGGIVVLDITHNGSSSDVHVLQEQLTFTAANYATGQQLQYAALLDGLVEGDETVDITISVNTSLTTAANYLSGTPDVVHTINLIDADSVPIVEIRGNTGAVTADGPGFSGDPNLPDYVSAYFSVTLTRPVDYTVEVNYATIQFTAVSGGLNPDFIAETGSVIFAPGEVVKLIDVDIVRDLNDEPNERFYVDITSVVGGNSVAVISSTLDRAEQIIVDDDDPRGVTFTSPPSGLFLGETASGAFLVALDEQPIDDVIVTLQLNGSNPGRFDGGGVTEVLTFTKYDWLLPQKVRLEGGSTAGVQTVSIQSITSVGDSDYNGLVDSSTFQFTNVGAIGASTPYVTITNGSTPEIGGQENVGIQILNLGGTPGTYTFDVTVYDTTGPIGQGDIIVPAPQTFTINYTGALGTDGVSFDVTIINDNHYEVTETFFVEITNFTVTSGLVPVFLKNQGVYDITDDLEVAPVPSANVGTVEGGGESGRDFRFLNNAEQLVVDSYLYYGYQVSHQDGTATTADNDYVPISYGHIIEPGTRGSAVVALAPVPDDILELDETITVSVFNSFDSGTNTITPFFSSFITNDDATPGYYVTNATATESSGQLDFIVGITNRDSADMLANSPTESVSYSTADGTAVAPGDYTSTSGTLTFTTLTGMQQIVSVPVNTDANVEADETMFINLSNPLPSSPTQFLLTDGQGVGTILDDPAPAVTISVSNASVTEGGILAFDVTLSGASSQIVSVLFSTQDGTATLADNDYVQIISQLITFNPGVVVQTVNVNTNSDTDFEPNETMFVNLSSPTNATIADGQGEGTILNDDVDATISVGDAIVTEGGVLGFEVTLSNSSSQTITVLASTSDGLATVADNDYTPITNQLITFAPGVTSQFVNVSTVADNKFEVNERMFLNLSSATNATILDSLGQGDILNDDAQPTISISDDSVAEGGTLNFIVSLSNPSYEVITVDFSTADGTATVADNDYTPVSQTLTFLSGQLSQTVSVSTMVDITFESDETLFANLSNPFNSTIADNQGVGTITNDDVRPTISITDASVTEGGVLSFTVSLSHVSFETIEVDYATADGTATLGDNDYTANSQTLTFLSGTLSQTVSVLTTADTKFELNENLFVNLTNPSNATISDAQGVGTILNDDAAPTVTIDDNNGGNAGVAEVLEGNPPDTNQLTFSITLSNTSYEDIAFTYSTADNTATLLDNDYTQVSGQIFTILAGSTSASFTVDVTADTKFEINEIVDVVLDVTSGAVTGSTNFGLQGVILNDDAAPTVTIDDNNGGNAGVAEVLEGNPPDTNQLTFSITLSNASYEDIEFTYSTADNTATLLDNDYTQVSGQTFTILAGATSASFTVDVTADTVYELDEAVDVTLDVTSGAVTGSTNFGLQGVILNDDAAPTVTIDDNNGGNAGVAEVLEGDPADTNQLTFSVSLSNASFEDLEFTYSTADNTATLLDNDYTQVSGQTFTILAGATSATFTVDVTSDLKFETDEIVNVNLDVTSGTVSGSTNFGLQGVILNDDLAPTISITTVSTSGIEGITGVPLGGDIITAAGNYVFQAILSNPTYEDLVIPVFTVDGIIPNFAATAGDNDFVPLNLSLTILSGDVMSSTVTVDFIADNKFEYDETFSVEIGTVTGSDGGQTTSGGVNSVDVTIINDDGAPILTIDDQTVAENVGSGVMTFTVTRTGFTAFDVDFTINTADNTAVQPTDYTQIVGGMGTVLAGGASNTTTFDVAIIDDGTFELTETFFANITADNATNVSATGNDLQGEGTITDDEPEPVVSITPDTATSINEGIEGVPPVIGVSNPTPNGTVDITISLTNPSFEDILVTINTNDGTNPIDFNTETAPAETPDGQGDLDYNPISQTFTILAGSTSETFTVSIVPDDKFEFDETFTVDITTVSGSVGGSMYVNVDTNNEIVPITIINDDDKPVIRVTVAPTVEGTAPVGPYGVGGPPTTPIVIGITRSGATAFDSFIQPTTPGGLTDTAFSTADLINNDNDYFFLTDLGTLIPASSATTENVTTFTIIEVIQDNKFEFDEMFTITNVLGAETLIDEANSDITFIATIINDDTAPTITINDSSVVDGDTGTQSVVFDIIESNPSYEPVVVTVDTSDGNSTNPDENAEVSDNDYIPLMTTVTFTEGVITDPDNPVLYDITKRETVEAIGDDKYELDEIFLVDLGVSGGSVNTQGSDLQGVGTIINNDLAPSISITPVIDEIPEGNTGTTEATFLIELTNPTYQDLYIDFSSINGGVIGVVPATANSDYMPTSGGVTIFENGLSQTVTALINGDFNYEPNEAFSIDLTGVYVNDSGQIPADLTGPIDNQGVVILNDDFPDFVIPTLIPRPIMDEYPTVFEYTPGPSPQILFQPFGWTIDTLEQVRESEPEIVVSPFFPDSQDEELEGFFTIYITEQPEKPLVIEISAEDLPEGAISPKTVTFTPDDWGKPKVISVEDPNWDPDKEIEIVTTVVESDEVYREVDAPDVNIQPIEVNSEEIIQK